MEVQAEPERVAMFNIISRHVEPCWLIVLYNHFGVALFTHKEQTPLEACVGDTKREHASKALVNEVRDIIIIIMVK